MATEYKPDKWVLLQIENKGYKIFGTWLGGYLEGDFWRVSSGITKVEKKDDRYFFYGYSGSVYVCHKDCYGTSAWSLGILNNMLEQTTKAGADVKIMPEDTDFLNTKLVNKEEAENESKETSPQSANTTKSSSH